MQALRKVRGRETLPWRNVEENDEIHRSHVAQCEQLKTAGGGESVGGKNPHLYCFSTLLQVSASSHCQRWGFGTGVPWFDPVCLFL